MANQDNTDDEPYYILVDFNGTLAKHDKGAKVIDDAGNPIMGEPIAKMVERVKARLASGLRVKIQCGTVGAGGPKGEKMAAAIRQWTLEHLGQELEATGTITPRCIEVWNDKAKAVVRNTGRFVGEEEEGPRRVWKDGAWVLDEPPK